MTKFLVNRPLTGAIATMASVLFLLTGCTNVDSRFGDDFIPPQWSMSTLQDSSVRVKTTLFKLDSLKTNSSSQTTLSFGSYIDPLVGRTTLQAFSAFNTNSFYNSDKVLNEKYFGTSPTLDSIFLYLDVVGAKGDTTHLQDFEVFRVKGHRFSKHESFYSNFDMNPYINENRPIAEFSAKGVASIKVALPREFGLELLETSGFTTETSVYKHDTLFHEKFNGFYFRAKNVANLTNNGSLVNLNIENSCIRLFSHNQNVPKKDTMVTKYTFQSVNSGQNVAFEMVQFDYSFADINAGGINAALIGTQTPTQFCYAQGMAGVGTMLHFPTEEIEALKQKAKDKGYNNIAVNRAELRMFMPINTWQNYNLSCTRLGMYYDFMTDKFIPDYNPIAEADAVRTGYVSYFGGNLNRSLGYYSMDITSYVQRLFSTPGTEPEVQMLPYYTGNLLVSRSQMYGSESQVNPPKLILTYTMLK